VHIINGKNSVQVAVNTAMDNFPETVPTHLPETALLNYLLQCKALLDLRKYMNMYFTIVSRKSYEGKQTISLPSLSISPA
jgi:hypothetical protein